MPTLPRLLPALLAGLLLLLPLVVLLNTWRPANRQLPPATPAPALVLDSALSTAHLAGALRIPTISQADYAGTDPVPFARLAAYLHVSFPLVHALLPRQVVNDFGVLYEWAGADPSLAPLLLVAHQDVVPVLEGTAKDWRCPPFAGQQAGGFLYGRGALDDKLNLVAQLEAVEYLLRAGYQPRRTVLLAFGHDEETQGVHGAAALSQRIASKYPHLAMVLDEGGLVKSDGLAGLKEPVALVGVSEKGYLSLELSAQGASGHSSMPPALTSIGRVAAAVARLEANPFPARLDGGAGELLRFLAPSAPFARRVLFSNQWLFGPLLIRTLAASPSGNATLRTSTAPTIIRGGDKDNVLPAAAVATVNFRLLPGDSVAGVIARVRGVVADEQISVHVSGVARDASPVSRTDNAPFAHLQRTIKSVFPTALVAPYVVVGATDARAYAPLCPEATYRFTPLLMDQRDIERLHGTDERISTAAYQDVIRFYVQLLRNPF